MPVLTVYITDLKATNAGTNFSEFSEHYKYCVILYIQNLLYMTNTRVCMR